MGSSVWARRRGLDFTQESDCCRSRWTETNLTTRRKLRIFLKMQNSQWQNECISQRKVCYQISRHGSIRCRSQSFPITQGVGYRLNKVKGIVNYQQYMYIAQIKCNNCEGNPRNQQLIAIKFYLHLSIFYTKSHPWLFRTILIARTSSMQLSWTSNEGSCLKWIIETLAWGSKTN